MLNKLLILGEAHMHAAHVRSVNEAIVVANPDYLLHELVHEDLALESVVLAHRIKTCRIGGLCDPRLNQDIYQLALTHGYGLVGIDIEVNAPLSFNEKFLQRETHMVKMIQRWAPRGDVVVVVGDAHLRDGSPLINYFSKLATIVRAPMTLREM